MRLAAYMNIEEIDYFGHDSDVYSLRADCFEIMHTSFLLLWARKFQEVELNS